MADYRLTPAARFDIRSIWNHTDDEWGSVQAQRYSSQIEETIRLLVRTPALGRPRDEIRPELRSHPCGRHIIFYRKFQNQIEVMRILHQRMDVKKHFRLKFED